MTNDFLIDCPICANTKYKVIVNELLIHNIAYENIKEHLYLKKGVSLAINDIKYHKENHFRVREEKAFQVASKQEEMLDIFERFRVGQTKSLNLINILNANMEQMIAQLEYLQSNNKSMAADKDILSYMKEMRQTAVALAQLKGELTENISINSHLIRNETQEIATVFSSVLEELAPDLKDAFMLKFLEKMEELKNNE